MTPENAEPTPCRITGAGHLTDCTCRPENTECQHVYDDDLLIGQQSRPGDLCRNCLEPKQDQTRADKIAACIDPEHVDQWLGPVDSDAP